MTPIMCVHLRSWPTDLCKRRQSAGSRHKSLVVVRTIGLRQLVAAACDQASHAGVHAGMKLAEARILCPDLAHADYDPQRDQRGLEALGRWMMQFSPFVSVSPPDSIFLDIGGSERLWGSLDRIARRVVDALNRLRINARVAIAPTAGAAWAFSRTDARHPRVVVPDALPSAIGLLPPDALRLDEGTVSTLHHLGITTIGDLLKIPRQVLPARFGTDLLKRIDQALGRVAEPLVYLTHQSPVRARMEFDGAVESLEAIWMVFRELIRQIVDQLIHRGCGARRLEVVFSRAYGAPIHKTVLLSRPSRDLVNLFNLLRCALETIQTDDGFTAIQLSVPAFERLSDEQVSFTDREQYDADHELDHLIERLRVRLGPDSMMRVELLESHLPEQAYRLIAPEHLQTSGVATALSRVVRPLHLLSCPLEIGVIVSPSEEGDGRPLSFTQGRQVHRIVHANGPERIEGIWWMGRHKTRDYFDVEDEAGRRFWVFHVLQTGKWYLHGLFE